MNKFTGRLEGKTAIVTGAAQGIGKAIAARFASEGARVLLADLKREAVEATAAAIGQTAVCVDVGDKDQIDMMVAHAIHTFGRVDILVNNAGMFHGAGLLELSEADFDRVTAVNVKSVLFAIQAVTPQMIERGGGAIVNVSSIAGALGAGFAVAYCVSKAAVTHLTTIASIALAPRGIRVNAIGPGTFATEMAQQVYDDPELTRQVLSRTPMGRIGEPEEAAGVALFLASDDASYVTGKTIYVDGGRLGLNLTVPVAQDDPAP